MLTTIIDSYSRLILKFLLAPRVHTCTTVCKISLRTIKINSTWKYMQVLLCNYFVVKLIVTFFSSFLKRERRWELVSHRRWTQCLDSGHFSSDPILIGKSPKLHFLKNLINWLFWYNMYNTDCKLRSVDHSSLTECLSFDNCEHFTKLFIGWLWMSHCVLLLINFISFSRF